MNLSRAHGCRLVMFLQSNYRADNGRLETSCQWPEPLLVKPNKSLLLFFEVFYPIDFSLRFQTSNNLSSRTKTYF